MDNCFSLGVSIDVLCPTDVVRTYDQCDTENAVCTPTSQGQHKCQCIGGYHPDVDLDAGGSKICVASKLILHHRGQKFHLLLRVKSRKDE